MNTLAQIFLDYAAAAATHPARVAWIHLYHTSPSFFRFVHCVLYQLTPCRVCDCFSETVILEHPSYIEILKHHYCKQVYQFPALLMRKILALVGYSLVNASNHL